ncbi:MAG: AMP-dependent synthetase/ligase [Deltaproteobacteria bacterium]
MKTITNEEVSNAVENQTIPTAFLATVREHGALTALRWKKDDGSFGSWTYNEYADLVARVAGGLAARGLGHGDRIVLMMRNIPEFHVIDTAAYFLGATSISIYNSSPTEQVIYLVNHCEAKMGFVEDEQFLSRFREARPSLSSLQSLGSLRDAAEENFTWEDLIGSDPIDLEQAAQTAKPDDLATMIYTSGTTGPPKGVMLTHRNIVWTAASMLKVLDWNDPAGKKLVSYLPMAHIAERMVGQYQPLLMGFTVTTCPEPRLVADYAREVRPNYFFGVPRIWEKMYAGIHAALAADPEKEAKFNDAVAAATPIVEKMTRGTVTEEEQKTWDFLDEVAFSQVRALIGLDECDLAMTGAAPIPAEMLIWFRAIGVPLAELYGLSETTGPMTFTAWAVKPGTVGQALPGCEVKLAEDGEVLARGGNVFQGYLNEAEKTAEALDGEGWLHTGDIGELDDEGYLKIVDRKKELIITAGGKNLSPANLESELKMIPLVGQACAIGDGRPFVSALVVLDPDAAEAWAKSHDMADATTAELAAHPDIIREIEEGLEGAMAKFNNTERVKKVTVLGEEWLPDSECLTPTSKLKRRGIHKLYATEIENLYS